jgi:hypothetical protein
MLESYLGTWTASARRGAPHRRAAGPCIIAAMLNAPELLTAAKIAAELKVSDGKVKKAIVELGLKPAAKKGVCSYYAKADVPKIKKALK